jgi:hypothetical protein
MPSSHSPYVFRDDPDGPGPNADHAGDEERATTGDQEVVIVDGRAMSYRWYRR